MKNKQRLDWSIPEIAEATAGFSGAQLKNLLNEAAILAAREGNTWVTKEHMENALEKIVVGITKKTDTRSTASRTRVAIHELGHAVLAAYFNDTFDLKKVSLKNTYNGVGGYTLFNEKPEIQESGLYTKDTMMKRLIVAFGGKAAEYLMYGENGVSNGASQDLKQANELARTMVEQYGMGEGMESYATVSGQRVSDKTSQSVDAAISQILSYAWVQSNKILTEFQPVRNALLIRLLNEQNLEGQTVVTAVGGSAPLRPPGLRH
jgi:cell division protease FtsH